MTTTTTATYTKLKSGAWGIRVAGAAKKGDRIAVTKKSGERKVETVTAVVWAGDGVTLCAIDAAAAPGRGMVTERQADAGYGRGRKVRTDCCGYPCPVTGMRCTPARPCHDCL